MPRKGVPTGRPTGRPSTFKKKYCEILIDQGKQGKTIAHFCATLGIGRPTFYDWLKANPEFRQAEHVADAMREAYWDDRMRENAEQNKGNSNMLKFYSSVRFGLSEKHTVDNQSSDGSMSPPSRIEIVPVAPENASDND